MRTARADPEVPLVRTMVLLGGEAGTKEEGGMEQVKEVKVRSVCTSLTWKWTS